MTIEKSIHDVEMPSGMHVNLCLIAGAAVIIGSGIAAQAKVNQARGAVYSPNTIECRVEDAPSVSPYQMVVPENPAEDDEIEIETRNYKPGILFLVELSSEKPVKFKHLDELAMISFHAKRVGIEPELLLAVRSAENGTPGREYGVLPKGKTRKRYANDNGVVYNGLFYPYASETEKQCAWAANILAKMSAGTCKMTPQERIARIQEKYAPLNVSNDPRGLNRNWTTNVLKHYNAAISDKEIKDYLAILKLEAK